MTVRLKLLLRVCAVASSLLLVTALVAYRAGALGFLLQAESIAVAATPTPETEKPVILGGSKSGVLSDLLPTPTGEPVPPWPRATATESPEDKIILGGSKSFVIDSKWPKQRAKPARPSADESARETTAPETTDATPTTPPNE